MKHDNFVKRRKVAKRLGLKLSLKQGTGGCNPCYRPDAGASKADLAEFHAEDMRLRRSHQRKLVRNCRLPRPKRNDDAGWRNREFSR